MLSGGELQGGTAWLTAGVAGWWWLRDVLCRGAPACVDWDWVCNTEKEEPANTWWCGLFVYYAPWETLGPGLVNLLGKDNIN